MNNATFDITQQNTVDYAILYLVPKFTGKMEAGLKESEDCLLFCVCLTFGCYQLT